MTIGQLEPGVESGGAVRVCILYGNWLLLSGAVKRRKENTYIIEHLNRRR